MRNHIQSRMSTKRGVIVDIELEEERDLFYCFINVVSLVITDSEGHKVIWFPS